MNSKEIFDKINAIISPVNNYLVFQTEQCNQYFGKDADGNIVFMMESSLPRIPPVHQDNFSESSALTL